MLRKNRISTDFSLNPSTLLKYVQTGSITSNNDDNIDDRFDEIASRKRKEIISPLMRRSEYRLYVEAVRNAMMQKSYSERRHSSDTQRMQKIQEISSQIPDHLLHDIFSMYFNSDKDMVMHDKNKPKQNILDAVVDPLLKIVTEQDYASSYFFSEEISMALVKLLSGVDEETRKQIMSGLDGEGSPEDMEQAAQMLKEILESDAGKQAVEESKKRAEERSDELDSMGVSELMGVGKEHEILKEMSSINSTLERMKAIHVSSGNINTVLKKILTDGQNYFSRIVEDVEEPLLETEFFEELLDLDYFIPALKKFKIFDVAVRNRKERGKFDVYIDFSGSMGYDTDPKADITLAKGVAVRLMKLGYVDNVYFFNTQVSHKFTNPLSVLKYQSGGGTSFNAVIKNCLETQKNSVVLTDGQDYDLCEYSEKIFWIGVGSSRLGSFSNNENGRKYLQNKQCIQYDGSSFEYVIGKNV